jgi:hypothetical protein
MRSLLRNKALSEERTRQITRRRLRKIRDSHLAGPLSPRRPFLTTSCIQTRDQRHQFVSLSSPALFFLGMPARLASRLALERFIAMY